MPAPAKPTQGQSAARTVSAAIFGNVLEWFDYAVFGFLVAPIGKSFFPADSAIGQTLGAWLVFAIGFFARPLGGIVLGRLGDRKGRRWLLTISVSLIAGSTLAIGCLPTFEQVGWLATAGLIACRVIQGFSLGGEFTGSMAYATEHAVPSRRGLIGGSTAVGSIIGFLAGSGAVALIDRTLDPAQIDAWGWRLPFLASSLAALLGWWLRRSVRESSAGLASCALTHRPPALVAIARDWKPSLQLLAIVAFANALYYYGFDAAVVSAKSATPERASEIQSATTLSLLVVGLSTVVGGWMSDRMGRRTSAILFTLWGMAVIVPAWIVMRQAPADPASFLCAQLLVGMPVGCALGMQGTMLVEMFPLASRIVSMSFAYSVAMACAGGLMPALDTWLVDDMRIPAATPAWICALGATALVTLWLMRDPTGRDLAK
jgi:MHS family proline/betaine transporter-like MFS transporter